MSEILSIDSPRVIGYNYFEDACLRPDEVRIRTLYSGISAGTQLTLFSGTNPFVSKKWNRDLRVFEDGHNEHKLYPVMGAWGYEEVGTVCETGAQVGKIKPGDMVYGTWGHKSSNIVTEDFALNHLLPEGLDPVCGIFSQMGSISLNAILDADIHIGETVAIFGQGVPGQIVTQLAVLNGAYVIAVDMDESRLEYSKKYGAAAVNASACDAAMEIKKLTGGRGADTAIEISGSYKALHEAIRSVSYNGKVVCSGFMQGNAAGLYLGEEFHHNRVNITCSQIEAVSPALSHRWNRLRMEGTVMQLQKEGRLDLKGLITHIFPFREAQKAYEMLDRGQEKCLQAVLAFDSV